MIGNYFYWFQLQLTNCKITSFTSLYIINLEEEGSTTPNAASSAMRQILAVESWSSEITPENALFVRFIT